MRPEGSVGLRSRSWSVAGEREGWSAASERTLRHGDDVAWCDREVGRQVTIVDDLVQADGVAGGSAVAPAIQAGRSEAHTSELQSLMRIPYAVSRFQQNKQTPTKEQAL